MTTTLILPNESFLSEGMVLTCKLAINGCVGCNKANHGDCDQLLCSSIHRSDFKSVIFVESASMIIAGKLVEQVDNKGCGKCAFAENDEESEPCRGCKGKIMYQQIRRN